MARERQTITNETVKQEVLHCGLSNDLDELSYLGKRVLYYLGIPSPSDKAF